MPRITPLAKKNVTIDQCIEQRIRSKIEPILKRPPLAGTRQLQVTAPVLSPHVPT